MFASLLVPPDATPVRSALSEQTIHDLDLHGFAHAMAHQGIGESAVLRILSELPQSSDEIRYRQASARLFYANDRFRSAMQELLQEMRELTLFSRGGHEAERPLLEAIWRLGELELYVDLVTRTREVIERVDGPPPAFALLYDELTQRVAEASFQELARELPALRAAIRLHRSVTIGVNLDDKLRPVEAALLRVNDRPFREGGLLGGFLAKTGGEPFVTMTPLERNVDPLSPATPDRLPLAPLFAELDSLMRTMLRPLARKLRAYVAVNTDLFRSLYPEIAFFLGSTAFLRSVADLGYEMTFPEIRERDARATTFRSLYNLRLASHWQGQERGRMVGNTVSLDDAARLYVLTGPNGGGKTTFTQAVGIATLLGQAGLPIPASAGEIAPVDTIETHFPTEEEFDDELGRFEDEARRVSDLFDRVTPYSMVLLNEPFSSTGPREAERIAQSVVTGLARAGVRGVFTTHYHELARNAERISGEVEQSPRTSRVGTLSAGIRYDEGRAVRTYGITEGPPAGSSFAEDVARRYRIDDESLRDRLRSSDGEQP